MTTASASLALAHDFAGRDALQAHSANFEKAVFDVSEGIYVAVGYSASNVTLIRGETGSIIVDTSANATDAAAIIKAFGNRFVRPVHAIIYTHNHPDHSGGATAFAGKDAPAIWSNVRVAAGKPELARGMRNGGDAFGTALLDKDFINAGIQLQYGRETPYTREGFMAPTNTFDGAEHELTIDGVTPRLLHTPGESEENTAVWLPEKKVLLAGDDLLKSFPNLSPIRGVRLRSPEAWISSLEAMISLSAEHLIPGHMQPVDGAAEVWAALTAYRDAIRYITDATVKGIKAGKTPDELVQEVTLPEDLAANPYLQEYYGCVAWTVRGIYADYVGWFDGNPTNMFPLQPEGRAERMIELVGGAETLFDQSRAALEASDAQWALELADHLIAANERATDATSIKIGALRHLGDRQINATALNYYLTVALSLQNSLRPFC